VKYGPVSGPSYIIYLVACLQAMMDGQMQGVS